MPPEPEGPRREVAECSDFSLHAGIAAEGYAVRIGELVRVAAIPKAEMTGTNGVPAPLRMAVFGNSLSRNRLVVR